MQLNFNAFDYDPSQGGSVCFPLADYRLQISAVEPKVVKDNPGAGFLEISLTVVDGDMKGMIQKDRLNIYNPSETAKNIALRQLAAYAFAIGVPQIGDTAQMIGKYLVATIGPQKDNDKYSEVKVVKCADGTLPFNPQKSGGHAPAAPAATAPAAPAGDPGPGASAPWGVSAAAAPAASAAPPWGTGSAAAPAATASSTPWGAPGAPGSGGAAAAPPWAK